MKGSFTKAKWVLCMSFINLMVAKMIFCFSTPEVVRDSIFGFFKQQADFVLMLKKLSIV